MRKKLLCFIWGFLQCLSLSYANSDETWDDVLNQFIKQVQNSQQTKELSTSSPFRLITSVTEEHLKNKEIPFDQIPSDIVRLVVDYVPEQTLALSQLSSRTSLAIQHSKSFRPYALGCLLLKGFSELLNPQSLCVHLRHETNIESLAYFGFFLQMHSKVKHSEKFYDALLDILERCESHSSHIRKLYCNQLQSGALGLAPLEAQKRLLKGILQKHPESLKAYYQGLAAGNLGYSDGESLAILQKAVDEKIEEAYAPYYDAVRWGGLETLSFSEQIRILNNGAQKGHRDAIRHYYDLCMNESNLPLQEKKIVLENGVKNNHPHALYYYYKLVGMGHIDTFDQKQRQKILEHGVLNGHIYAKRYYYSALSRNYFQANDLADCLSALKKASDQGDLKAQHYYYNVARFNKLGLSQKQGLEILKAGVQANHEAAQYHYYRGYIQHQFGAEKKETHQILRQGIQQQHLAACQIKINQMKRLYLKQPELATRYLLKHPHLIKGFLKNFSIWPKLEDFSLIAMYLFVHKQLPTVDMETAFDHLIHSFSHSSVIFP